MGDNTETISLQVVKATAEKITKGENVTKEEREAAMAFVSEDIRKGEAGSDVPAGREFLKLRNGDYSNQIPSSNLSIDEFIKERYGFSNLPTFLNAVFGLNPKVHTLQNHLDDIANTGNQTGKFSSVMSSGDFDNSFRWLIPEAIMRYVIRGMQTPATSVDYLISGTDNVMNDEFKVPAVLAGDTRPNTLAEGQTIKLSTLRFGEKTVRTKMFGKGLAITDITMRKTALDIFGVFLKQLGRDIMIAESMEALKVLINGEAATEAAATVGVTAAGTLKDRDVWRVIHKLEELGYSPDYVIGSPETILALNELPMFRGYDGAKQEGKLNNEGLSYTTPNLRTISRADMPVGKLLFGSKAALRKAVHIPYRVENDRDAKTLETAIYVSGSTGYYIANTDARIIVDLSLDIATNGFPASMDLYADNGFKA